MKFAHKYSSNPTYSNPLTILRENSRYEILRYSDYKVAFSNRRPRKNWRGWHDGNHLIWDSVNKEVVKLEIPWPKICKLSNCFAS
jgi:hypothetical protein